MNKLVGAFKNKDRRIPFLLQSACLAVVILLSAVFPSFFTDWESRFHDLLFKLRNHLNLAPRVNSYLSIVAPDDQFLIEGNYPYLDSNLLLRLAHESRRQGARITGADFIFLGRIFGGSAAGVSTREVKNGIPDLYFPLYVKEGNPDQQNESPEKDFGWDIKVLNSRGLPVADRIYHSIDAILENYHTEGHINLIPDRDGINRRLPLFYRYKDKYIPAYALVLACRFLEVEPSEITLYVGKYLELGNAHFPGGMVKDIRLPVDERGRIIINYPGEWHKTFNIIQPQWLLEADINPEFRQYARQMSQDMLVLIGEATTIGKDFTASVFEPVYPAVGIMASVLNSILCGQFIRPQSAGYKVITWLILTGLLFLTGLFKSPTGFCVFTLLLIFLHALFSTALFALAGWLPCFLLPQLYLYLSLISLTVYKQLRADKRLALGIIDKVTRQQQSGPAQEKPVPVPRPVVPGSSHEEIFAQRCEEYGITKRQRQIILLTHDGFESGEVAYKLDISPRTVANHLANIYQKAGTHNKMEMIKLFFYG